MAKNYKGSLSLEWYNKQYSILLRERDDNLGSTKDIPAPKINWVNKDEALFYEINEEEGKGLEPYWVDRNDIRIKEARPLILKKVYKATAEDMEGTIPGTAINWQIERSGKDIDNVDNILIKGDNLLVLNALMKLIASKPEEEKVKCIYIDPPYNTGSAFEHYEDSLAHSEWLTLMKDRLIIMRELLRENGSIWISIDGDESHYLKLLCDEIFGRSNFIEEVIWQRAYSPINLKKTFSRSHDYILVYAKNINILNELNKLPRSEEANSRYSNTDNDKRGPWKSGDLSVGPAVARNIYEISTPSGRKVLPPRGRSWVVSEHRFLELKKENRIWFGPRGDSVPSLKRFLADVKEGVTPMTLWLYKDVGHNQDAKREVKQINQDQIFDTPKPERLLERILLLATDENDIVLDCFAGAGTTLAVAHKMKRRWIGVEIGNHLDTHILPRLENILKGIDRIGISENGEWQGGGSFKYYHLGPSIIKVNKDGTGDFNWSLGKKFIEESLLLSYDYEIDKDIVLDSGKLFSEKDSIPTVGVQRIGTKCRVAIVSLNEPKGKLENITYEEVQALYKAVKKKHSPEYVNIFTNRGIEIAYDSKPEDFEVIKVPTAIFAELEK